MINIRFYSFAKRTNSTKQPTGTGTELSCLIKSDSSIINPVIELSTDPTAFNYCYIPSFNRYYYINDIVFQRGIWLCYCNVDVLTSWKTEIGNTSGYCVRASAMYDGTLQDDAWTPTTDYTLQISSDSTAQYVWAGFAQGYYVVGVKGNNNTAVNGVIYYQLTPADFRLFINQFYSRTGDNTFFGNLARGIADSIYQLSDFIVSCRWYPFALYSVGSEDVYIGSQKVGNLTAPVLTEYPIELKQWTFTVPKHPEAAGRGVYMNAAPYTRYVIKTPWGLNIPLDSYYMRDLNSITLSMRVDFTTGQAALEYGHSIPNVGYFSDYITYINFGVDIPLSGTDVSVSGVIGNTAGALANVFSGNALGALANVGNALLNATPTPDPLPSRGGYAPLTMSQPYLASYFYGVAHVDYIHHGRPYCRNVAPSFIGSGYMEFEKFDVAISGTQQEASSINSYMVQGIYYE